MNHSRYSLPSRTGKLLLIVAGAWFGGFDLAMGQETGPALVTAGIAVPNRSGPPPAFTSPSGAPFGATSGATPYNGPAASLQSPFPSTPSSTQPSSLPPAQPGASAPSPLRSALPDPQQLLAGSCRMLARQKSIVAKVRHRATIYDRELIGSGEYAQGPELARLLRYELRMQVDKRVVNFLQVADGRHLWISTLLEDEPEIERVDIDRVLAATDPTGQSIGDPNRQLGLGGLSQLMAAISKDFEFNTVFKSQLDGLPVYGIEGRWKKEALDVLDPARAKPDAKKKVAPMRPHVPDRIVLFLGVDDFFPYRYEFRRTVPPKEQGTTNTDAAINTGEASKVLLVLEFFQVQFDVPLEERTFQFSPGSRRVADVTDKFLSKRAAVP